MNPDRVVIGSFDEEPRRCGRRVSTAGSRRRSCATDVASAEMIKSPSNAFLATKISFINEIANVCEATGADVGQGRRGNRLGPPYRHELPPGRESAIGGSCFPKDIARAEAARGQLGLSLPASQRRHRGQRAPEAPGDRQAEEASSGRCAARRSPARPRLQAEHERHAARRRASCSPHACSPRVPTYAPGTRSRRAPTAAARASLQGTTCREALDGADAAVHRHRVGRGRGRSRSRPRSRRRMGAPCSSTAGTCSTPTRRAPPASSTSRSAAPRSLLMEAIVLAGGHGRAAR